LRCGAAALTSRRTGRSTTPPIQAYIDYIGIYRRLYSLCANPTHQPPHRPIHDTASGSVYARSGGLKSADMTPMERPAPSDKPARVFHTPHTLEPHMLDRKHCALACRSVRNGAEKDQRAVRRGASPSPCWMDCSVVVAAGPPPAPEPPALPEPPARVAAGGDGHAAACIRRVGAWAPDTLPSQPRPAQQAFSNRAARAREP
jgi:hypothetical protein